MSEQPNKQVSAAAQELRDILGLGKSGEQRRAEMLAGIRAELMPKPEYMAMTRMAGRIIGSTLLRLSRGDQAKINAVIARPEAFRYLVRQALQGKTDAHYVELVSGFLPRAWQMAHEFPHLRVTEVDLPDMIAEKRRRFERAKLPLPPNLQMLSTELCAKPLAEILGGEQADAISAEGLLPYFELDRVQHIAACVRQSLKDDGVFIADILTKEIVHMLTLGRSRQAAGIFRRNVGKWLGVVNDRAHAEELFKAAGYAHVETYKLSEVVAPLADVRKPVADLTLLIVARR
ncbi:MAG: class I SAM-dependent methyltransferase [Chloroflexi bacterium]|jgi:O-methyltransferase involved in polyketide biosynthesis|nr:class I SAM-dependent methyltransferase [Chloroflexota bacterium]